MQNKHIIRLSFLGIFFSVIANIIFYRQFILGEIILREISENNKSLVHIYESQIWQDYSSVVKKLLVQDKKLKYINGSYIEFAKKTSLFFENKSIIKMQMFDKYGNELFRSNDLQITPTDLDKTSWYDFFTTKLDYFILSKEIIYDGFSKGLSGKHVTGIFPKVSVLEGDESYNAVVIADYIPLWDEYENVEAMIVIYTDTTFSIGKLSFVERNIFAILTIAFCLFFVIVIRNTNKAQRVINKQLQINRLLEEAKLRAEDETKSKADFLANISHELRTPLNTIIGFAEIILSQHGDNIDYKKYNDYVADILHAGKHLLSVINDILDYSKANADKLKVEMIDVDVNKIAQSSIRFLDQRAKEAGINLLSELPINNVIIKADPKRLRQAFLNLLSNAIKFTPVSGSVKINISKNFEKRLVCIRIIDTGIGIEKRDIPKALASFGQVDNSFSRKYEGTGLGLPLTKKLVELMNGRFEIESTVGVGTTVTLIFEYSDN